ncbi:MAG: hypothetical protein DRP18_00020 [Candidatus Aenigmatarchaeota archaeon]|nr:MAG: hypothetical protein DRP18_00020 [Candidatus Aenigmarchaeota archaeon]
MIESLVRVLVYPGVGFIVFFSFLYSGIFRKISARMQHRIGPPIWQPFFDILKLLGKEDIKPEQAKIGYTFWPFVAMISIITAGLLTPIAGVVPLGNSDIVVLIYFLVFGSLCLYLSGFSSSNPFAVIGSVRGIIQMIGYEFPFVVSVAVAALASGRLLLFPAAVNMYQISNGWLCLSFPFAAAAFFVSVLAKVEIPPFHIPEAHQEIVSGYYTEYTGKKLAMILIAHMVKLFVLIALGIALFFGGSLDILTFIAKGLVLVFVVSFFRVILARFRIDHALKFCWVFGFVGMIDLFRVLLGF